MTDLINCGERTVQAVHRIALGDIFRNHGIKKGDIVDVYIKISKHDKKQE